MDLHNIRREYLLKGLRRKDLPANPHDLFKQWLQQCIDVSMPDPTAMTVATVDENNRPFQRIVLLKSFDEKGFVFYTNLGSRKAIHIQNNNQVSLHFPWHNLERQIHIVGHAEKLSSLDVAKYFLTRPKESQLAALASKQSTRLSTRGLLEGKFLELKLKYEKSGEIPVPTFWGGYRVVPEEFEFWQGGQHRLHDRFVYSRSAKCHEWEIDRLAP